MRAAFTAASTSRLDPCDVWAMRVAVAGLVMSNVFDAFVHAPPMKWPNFPSCFASHSRAAVSLSGAGPYSMVS